MYMRAGKEEWGRWKERVKGGRGSNTKRQMNANLRLLNMQSGNTKMPKAFGAKIYLNFLITMKFQL